MSTLFLVPEIQDLCEEMLEVPEFSADPPECMQVISGLDPDVLDEMEDSGITQDYVLNNYSTMLDLLGLTNHIDADEYHRLIELYNEAHRNACAYHDEQIVMRAEPDNGELFYDPEDYESPFGDPPSDIDPFYEVGYGQDSEDIYGPDDKVPEALDESVRSEVIDQIIILP